MAYSIANELELGPVLYWSITTRSTLQQGLYRYDAIGRLQASKDPNSREPTDIEAYIELGPLGTALLPSATPRLLLIDSPEEVAKEWLGRMPGWKMQQERRAQVPDPRPKLD